MPGDSTWNATITVLCGPHTGVMVEDIFRRAKVRQDHDAADTMHGHIPTWDELTAEQQQNLALRTAEQWWRDFQTASPADPRPIDHRSASSPPWPAGAAELEYWIARFGQRLDELTLMAAAQSVVGFVHGRLDEARYWAHQFEGRGKTLPAHPEYTGADEVAYWITVLDARVTVLADRGDGIDHAQGQLAEATERLTALRGRQKNRATPMFWHYGGRGLLTALGLMTSGSGSVRLADDVVVVAAHDAYDQLETISTRHRDVVRVLRAWSGQDGLACEQAIRIAHAHHLVDGRTPGEVTTTLQGDRLYQELLEMVG